MGFVCRMLPLVPSVRGQTTAGPELPYTQISLAKSLNVGGSEVFLSDITDTTILILPQEVTAVSNKLKMNRLPKDTIFTSIHNNHMTELCSLPQKKI